MTHQIHIRQEGTAGRITLDRPGALNALTYDMCGRIEHALEDWEDDASIKHVMIDAVGEKAFCAGGDIQDLYAAGKAGDFSFGQRFWADEYRLNARLAEYPKPVISFLQGFTMGGGVGIGCHGSHRVVDANSQIAMPECSIGLVPDVGGSLILGRAPGRLGEYLGLTTARMAGADAIYAGFADFLIPMERWPELKEALIAGQDTDALAENAVQIGETTLPALQDCIDAHFSGDTLGDILHALKTSRDTDFATNALKMIARNSPLAMACAVQMIQQLRAPDASIRTALTLEYRFTFRALEHSDFIEGVRAQVIDKDRAPKWQHDLGSVPKEARALMLSPLGVHELSFEKKG